MRINDKKGKGGRDETLTAPQYHTQVRNSPERSSDNRDRKWIKKEKERRKEREKERE